MVMNNYDFVQYTSELTTENVAPDDQGGWSPDQESMIEIYKL